MSKRGTRKSTILKRRQSASERLTRILRVSAIAGGVALFFALLVFILDGERYGRMLGEYTSAKTAQISQPMGFEIRNVLVEGRNRIDPAVLQDMLAITGGEPILTYDIDAAAERLKDISWIKNARIERRLPDTIVVMIEERKALALWQQDGQVRVIDAEGMVVSPTVEPEDKTLLLVIGEEAEQNANDLLTALRRTPDLKTRIENAVWVGKRRWDIVLQNGIVVKLPEKHLEEALVLLSKKQKEEDILSRPLDHVDLRNPERLIVKPRPGQAGEIPLDLVKGPADPA